MTVPPCANVHARPENSNAFYGTLIWETGLLRTSRRDMSRARPRDWRAGCTKGTLSESRECANLDARLTRMIRKAGHPIDEPTADAGSEWHEIPSVVPIASVAMSEGKAA